MTQTKKASFVRLLVNLLNTEVDIHLCDAELYFDYGHPHEEGIC